MEKSNGCSILSMDCSGRVAIQAIERDLKGQSFPETII